mmetsp:Transcript_16764/g.28135  ORF Transcript_16764/g.28135 Transcript_16764/m.28135 type:complete len:82 (-) Transcript_16764:303-548(-)
MYRFHLDFQSAESAVEDAQKAGGGPGSTGTTTQQPGGHGIIFRRQKQSALRPEDDQYPQLKMSYYTSIQALQADMEKMNDV